MRRISEVDESVSASLLAESESKSASFRREEPRRACEARRETAALKAQLAKKEIEEAKAS